MGLGTGDFMSGSTPSKIGYKKLRGRPPGTKYSETVPATLEPGTVADIDMWATENGGVSRREALRRLVEIGLKAEALSRPSYP